ncbi:polyketide synthase [Aspergillus ustus]|uniref:Polyketide synthase n=1 Tax=Aspergillus ustus TaxID=40382 RepID=A0A0C1E183_ASPUT|nr:polyketide synthase [Aspergillus ustus]
MLMATWSYLHRTSNVDMRDLAYTLQHRQSILPYRAAVAAPWIQNAKDALEMIHSEKLGIRHNARHQPVRVLGIFTGQGAQLVEKSPFAGSRIAELDTALQTVANPDHHPTWSIYDQLIAEAESSRVTKAAVSQPLCLAVQILLVDILRAAGISLTAVVGYLSGELGAAYAAGMISVADAIRVVYLRGLHAYLAASPNPNVTQGAMVAVNILAVEGKAYCNNHFAGRLDVAAENSPSSVMLSGDEDAVTEVIQDFQAWGIFSRLLKVNMAYYSVHMLPCARPFLDSLNVCGIEPCQEANISCPVWFSTVFAGEKMSTTKLTNQYWVDNMCKPVLFKGALALALEKDPFDLAIEIGPRPALKGPAASMLDYAAEVPYTGLIHRGGNDIDELSSAFGYIWTHLGANSVQFSAVEKLLSGTARPPTMLEDLPPYPFDHMRDHWHDGRLGDHSLSKIRTHLFNPLLGIPCLEGATPGVYKWRNILRPSEIIWLSGHQLQGQTVFPATGYISAAVEAIRLVLINTRPEYSIQILQLADLEITRAMVFDTDDAAIETIFSLSSIITTEDTLGSPGPDSLDIVANKSYNLVSVGEDYFYSNLSRIGYNYSSPFHGVSDIQRKLGYCTSRVINQSGSGWEDNLTLHPGMLDSALQTILAAWSYPGDGQICSLHAPVSVASIIINPYFTALGRGRNQDSLNAVTSIRSKQATAAVGDVFLHTADASHAFVRFEGVSLVPVSPATPVGDKTIFARFENAPAFPESEIARAKDGPAGLTSSTGEVGGSVSMQDCSENKLMVDSFHYEGSSAWGSAVAECVSRAILSISHRYPRCDICEINGGAGDTSLAVLDAIEGRYGSYTFTDASAASTIFFEGSYDIIVAMNVCPTMETVESSSSNLGRLLRPGGFLLSIAVMTNDTRAGDVAMPTAPLAHKSFESSLPTEPLLSLSQWDTALKATGFAGVDAIFPAARTSQQFVLFVTQAVDHRVSWLRNPLSFETLPTGVQTGTLVIIGGTTWPVFKLAQDIAKLAARRFSNMRTFSTLKDYAAFQQPLAGTVAGGISILSLTDLDEPYLARVTSRRFEALKACDNARTMIWATCGSQEHRPYSYMMTGIARTIKSENPTMHIQIYDLDPNLPNCIQPLDDWGDDASLLWTIEPEVYVRGGRLLIPRLVPNHEKNARYNSRYWAILETVDPHSVSLELAGLENGKLDLRQLSPLALLPGPVTESRTLRVTHSVLQSVFAGSAGFLRVCAGIEISTGDSVVALTTSETTPAKVPAAWCISVATPPTAELLVSIAAHLVAVRIMSYASTGSSIFLHGVDAAVERAVQARASKDNMNVIITTTMGAYRKRAHSIRSLYHKPIVTREMSLFVNFSQDLRSDAFSHNGILEALPLACLRLDKSAFLSYKVVSENIGAPMQIAHVADLL